MNYFGGATSIETLLIFPITPLRMKNVAVIGLGYVGLPLACLAAEKGIKVTGIDIDKNKIALLKKSESPIKDEALASSIKKYHTKINFSHNFEDIKNAEVIIVCVPTPVDDRHMPDLKPLISACTSIAPHFAANSLIVIESTIFPGTVEEIVQPIFEKTKKPFLLSHCPERIDPGNKKFGINNLPRVVGGINTEATKKTADFYRSLIDVPVLELSSVKAAEATKIMENTFRDINIAFINEMAMSFDKAGIDIMEVIKGASTKPFAFMPHYPGIGVGGHCIPVDPYYLIEKAKQIGFNHEFLSLARQINNNMPHYTFSLLETEMKKLNAKIQGAKIGILGIAYKANVDDTRESPSLKIIELLKQKKAEVMVYDPYVPSLSTCKSIAELLAQSDYIILATDHVQFTKIPASEFKKNGIRIIIDGKNCLDKEAIKKERILYHGIGRF